MAGHSKWANIKHRKQKSDAKKGKIFTKIVKEIYVAVKEGGSDPETNNSLSDAIAKAKSNNMPNDNIERAIKKASGDMSMGNFDRVIYEGYGPGGVAIIIETMTDNRNRTAADVRHYLDKFNGNLGTNGCVSYLFNKKGVIIIAKSDDVDEEELMMTAIEAGAEDFKSENEYYEIITEPGDFSEVRKTIEKEGYSFESAELDMIPVNWVEVNDAKDVSTLEKLIDNLEDLDDVQNIYHNYNGEFK